MGFDPVVPVALTVLIHGRYTGIFNNNLKNPYFQPRLYLLLASSDLRSISSPSLLRVKEPVIVILSGGSSST